MQHGLESDRDETNDQEEERALTQTKNKSKVLLMRKYEISKHKIFFIHLE